MNREEFIRKSKEIYGDEMFDYSKVSYINLTKKVTLKCIRHNTVFKQTPARHLKKICDCKFCKYEALNIEIVSDLCLKYKTLAVLKNRNEIAYNWVVAHNLQTTLFGKVNRIIHDKKQFVIIANKVHSNKYDYSNSLYHNLTTKIEIICPKHGPFCQKPNIHLNGKGCPICSKENKTNPRAYTLERFKKLANKVHGSYYDYSSVKFNTITDKIDILCPTHGVFRQQANLHISGRSCPKCSKVKAKQKAMNNFITKAKEVHGDKYDYSKVEYVNCDTKVIISCPHHGDFRQTPTAHLKGQGCQKCGYNSLNEKLSMGKESFIDISIAKFSNKYDYSKVNYVNAKTNVTIICPIHGEFEQNPYVHLNSPNGCPQCAESKLEAEVVTLLKELNIPYIREHKFKASKVIKSKRYDFFIPSINLVIECHGKQHFQENHFFHRTKQIFEERIEADNLKEQFCISNNINYTIYTRKGFTERKDIHTDIPTLKLFIEQLCLKEKQKKNL